MVSALKKWVIVAVAIHFLITAVNTMIEVTGWVPKIVVVIGAILYFLEKVLD